MFSFIVVNGVDFESEEDPQQQGNSVGLGPGGLEF